MNTLYKTLFLLALFNLPLSIMAWDMNAYSSAIGKTFLQSDTIIMPLKGINSRYADYGGRMLPGDTVMIFTSRRRADNLFGNIVNLNDENIWWVSKHNGVWDTTGVKPLKYFNNAFNNSVAGISPDGSDLYIFSDNNGGDILVSNIDSILTEPKPVEGDINTPYNESTITFLPCGRVCFFSSNRTDPINFGGMDIFRAEKNSDGRWVNVQNVGSGVNTPSDENFVSYSAIDSVVWFSSNRPGGSGKYDIYGSRVAENGWLTSPKNIGKPVNTYYNDISWYRSGNKAWYSTTIKDSAENIFEVLLPDIRLQETFVTKLEVIPEPVKENTPEYYINDIQFSIGSNNIAVHKESLDKLAELMKKLTGIKIAITGYTDSLTGGEITNNLLSLDRATTVAKYLIRKGVDPLRITVKAGGDRNPIASEAAPNRRVEFTVLEQDNNGIVKVRGINQKQ